MKPGQCIISNIEAIVENVGHDLMVHRVESCGHVEKHQSTNLATIDHLNHIIVQSHQRCFRGVVATVRRLIVRGQVVRVRVGDKPTINNSLNHLRHKTEVQNRPIRVEIEWIQRRFLEDRTRDCSLLFVR